MFAKRLHGSLNSKSGECGEGVSSVPVVEGVITVRGLGRSWPAGISSLFCCKNLTGPIGRPYGWDLRIATIPFPYLCTASLGVLIFLSFIHLSTRTTTSLLEAGIGADQQYTVFTVLNLNGRLTCLAIKWNAIAQAEGHREEEPILQHQDTLIVRWVNTALAGLPFSSPDSVTFNSGEGA
jgi:hypothetical protein